MLVLNYPVKSGQMSGDRDSEFSSGMRIIFLCVLLLAAACAPEPTDPSDVSLAGTWTSNAHLYTLSNFRMVIVQEPQGIVSGNWFAKGDGGGGGCAEATPCDATGELIGRNTVSQVEIALLGAGRFEGALLSNSKLRGIFAVGENFDTITFVRSGTVAQRSVP